MVVKDPSEAKRVPKIVDNALKKAYVTQAHNRVRFLYGYTLKAHVAIINLN